MIEIVGIDGSIPGAAWLPVLRSLGARPWFGKSLYVAAGSTLFDSGGRLTDEATRERLRDYLEGFAGFVGDPARR